jgi:hypothetical protein
MNCKFSQFEHGQTNERIIRQKLSIRFKNSVTVPFGSGRDLLGFKVAIAVCLLFEKPGGNRCGETG